MYVKTCPADGGGTMGLTTDGRWEMLQTPAAPAAPQPDWEAPPTRSLGYKLSTSQPWLIGPCIRPADFVYFVGADGEGKSTLIADILIGIFGFASGQLKKATCLAGAWPINTDLIRSGSRCLIINAETSGSDEWAHRLMSMSHTRGYAPNSEADFAIRNSFDFTDSESLTLRTKRLAEDATRLAEWIAASGYSVVCLDPIYGVFRPDEGAGDDTWVNHGLRPLVNTLKSHGILTIGIAHNNLAAQKARRDEKQHKYRPHGSGQQNGLMDCRFGVFRPEKNPKSTRLVKLKDRRAGWIPVGKAMIELTYAPTLGFSSYEFLNDIKWDLNNPEPFSLPENVIELIKQLPLDARFYRSAVTDNGVNGYNVRAALDRYRDKYLLAQDILIMSQDENERGQPIIFRWTEAGLNYRLRLERLKR